MGITITSKGILVVAEGIEEQEEFEFYARGSEQVKRVQALCKELNIDIN